MENVKKQYLLVKVLLDMQYIKFIGSQSNNMDFYLKNNIFSF